LVHFSPHDLHRSRAQTQMSAALRGASTLRGLGHWGVQLAGSFSEGEVLARFEWVRRRYEAVVGDHLPPVVPRRLWLPA
jgi:hypothetical protein